MAQRLLQAGPSAPPPRGFRAAPASGATFTSSP